MDRVREPCKPSQISLGSTTEQLILRFVLYSYYALVAACILARKAEVIRNACLAAALVFPAVAALHGIVLAVVHINGRKSVRNSRDIRG